MDTLVIGGSPDLRDAVIRRLHDEGRSSRTLGASSLVSCQGETVAEHGCPWQVQDPEGLVDQLEDIDQVIHLLSPPPPSLPPAVRLFNWFTRGTYALLVAAREAGVREFVVVSSLDIFRCHPDQYCISESWAPAPPTEDVPLGQYLAEETYRVFSRCNDMSVAVLRLGSVVLEEDVAGQTFNPLWIDARDVAVAVSRARAAPRHPFEEKMPPVRRKWRVFHLSLPVENPRFSATRATGLSLQFQPEHLFRTGAPADREGDA